MIDKKASEKLLEKKLREGVKKQGGIALKFHCLSFTGMPDRMVLMPEGKIFFVELKSEGKKPSARQEIVHKLLRDLGFSVFVIDTNGKNELFFKLIC